MFGNRLVPGHNVDKVDIDAGMKELVRCGYDEQRTKMVILYALQRWERGEEAAAERGAPSTGRSTGSTSRHGGVCWQRQWQERRDDE